MAESETMVQLLSPEGVLCTHGSAAEYLPYIDALTDDALRTFYRDMAITRRFDVEAANLQRSALEALAATLAPSELTVPGSILDLIPPRPPGWTRTRNLCCRWRTCGCTSR